MNNNKLAQIVMLMCGLIGCAKATEQSTSDPKLKKNINGQTRRIVPRRDGEHYYGQSTFDTAKKAINSYDEIKDRVDKMDNFDENLGRLLSKFGDALSQTFLKIKDLVDAIEENNKGTCDQKVIDAIKALAEKESFLNDSTKNLKSACIRQNEIQESTILNSIINLTKIVYLSEGDLKELKRIGEQNECPLNKRVRKLKSNAKLHCLSSNFCTQEDRKEDYKKHKPGILLRIDRVHETLKKYRQKNKEKLRKQQKEYYDINKAEICKKRAERRDENREEVNAKERARYKIRQEKKKQQISQK